MTTGSKQAKQQQSTTPKRGTRRFMLENACVFVCEIHKTNKQTLTVFLLEVSGEAGDRPTECSHEVTTKNCEIVASKRTKHVRKKKGR